MLDSSEKELKKPLAERLKEEASISLHLSKGVAQGALKLLEDGSVLPFIFDSFKDSCHAFTDFKKFGEEKKQQKVAIVQFGKRTYQSGKEFAKETIQDPVKKLHELWNGGKEKITSATIDFIKSPKSKQAEVVGEFAPTVALSAIGLEEAIALTKARKLQKIAQRTASIADQFSARNRVLHEAYKRELRIGMRKPLIKDAELKKFIDKFWRNERGVGNGSPMAAIRYEKLTGQPVKNKWHSEKSEKSLIYFERWLKKNPIASPGDRANVENLVLDLKDALQYKD